MPIIVGEALLALVGLHGLNVEMCLNYGYLQNVNEKRYSLREKS